MRWLAAGVVAGALCLPAAVPGCLRAAKDRTERDREVGRASAAGIAVDVDQGHAAVLALEPDRLVLWGSVPAFELRLTREVASAQPLQLEVRNLMSGAELTRLSGVVVVVAEPERLLETRARWNVRFSQPGEVRLRVGPPDADEPEEFQ